MKTTGTPLLLCCLLSMTGDTYAQFGPSVSGGSIIQSGLVAFYGLSEGTGQAIYSRTTALQSTVNMVAAPEQFFGNNKFWTPNANCAFTDLFSAAPNGSNVASRLFLTNGNAQGFTQNGMTISSGITYTASCYVKSNVSSNQIFRLMQNVGGFTISSDKTASNAWQRYSYSYTPTATSSSGAIYIINGAAQGSADLQVWGIQLEQGASATDYNQNWQGNFGTRMFSDSSDPSWTAKPSINTQGSKWCFAVSSLPTSFSAVTIYAVVAWTGTPVLAGFVPILTTAGSTGLLGLHGATADTSNQPAFEWNSNVARAVQGIVNDGAWHVFAASYDGTNQRVYVDGALLSEVALSAGAVTVSSIFLGNLNNAGYWPGEIASMALYSTAHSPAQVTAMNATLHNLVSMRGVSAGRFNKLVCYEGDSITGDGVTISSSLKYPYLATRAATGPIQGRNFAVQGQNVTNWNDRANTVDAMVMPSRICILSALEGNSLITSGAATWFSQYKSYCQARRAAGWRVIATTMLPRTTAGFNTQRSTANTSIRNDPSFYDALADFATNATVGVDAAASNTTYYGDGVHPTSTTQGIIYTYTRDAINSITY